MQTPASTTSPSLPQSADLRQQQLCRWLENLPQPHGVMPQQYQIALASADASFRRYFRVTPGDAGSSLIVMDAPPAHEDCRPFVAIAGLLGSAGVHAPQVLAQDLNQGFLLLSDLGSTTYLAALGVNADAAQLLYRDALAALVVLQATDGGTLPVYGEVLLRRELELFPEWYLGRHQGLEITPKRRAMLDGVFSLLLENNLAQARVFVHRDYHCRNLMFTPERNPGVLDFQDAVMGPITYDLVSLLRDAYVEWEEAQQIDWAIRYWEQARAAGLPVPPAFDDFYRDFEWMGLQRHLKVLGIFARLYHRDGKDGYLRDLPLVVKYVRRVCERYGVFKPLGRLFAELDAAETSTGYSF